MKPDQIEQPDEGSDHSHQESAGGSDIKDDIDDLSPDEDAPKKDKHKRGIVYLSTIPPNMTVIKLREIFEEFGELGRVFLQPDEKNVKGKQKHSLNFSEGWVEFIRKRAAKEVAATLNNNKLCTRKKSRFYDHIWNVKYLPSFKWVHLSERLAYERAVHKHRMQAETMQAKREASHFQASVERSERIRKLKRKDELRKVMAEQGFKVPQRLLAAEHRSEKPQEAKERRSKLLSSLFSKTK